jgi:pyridoxamine 5'-phosphate oxidase
MSFKDVYVFANQNPACFIGTVEGEKPRVRGFLMWFADEGGFYFHTSANKRIFQQLKQNPNIEACFYNPEQQPTGKMLRVCGKADFVSDLNLKSRLLEERPFLKAIVSGADDPSLVIFRIHSGQAHFWTMENNTREDQIEIINF